MWSLAAPLLMSAQAAAAADPSKVQVYVLMGQSNMVGMGSEASLENAVQKEHMYPYLVDPKTGNWTTLEAQKVRNVYVMGSGNTSFVPGWAPKGQIFHNEWMGVNFTTKKTIGVEIGVGFTLANYSQSGTMVLKSCIGNRALGWDLLPPGSKEFDFTDSQGKEWTYAGYHESPEKWPKGTTPKPMGWFAGEQYDGDTDRSKALLDDLPTYFPGATGSEVAGIFWFQGCRDSMDDGLTSRYEPNLVNFIAAVREFYDAPSAKFVMASVGEAVKGGTTNADKLLQAELNVDGDSGKYPQFKGNVKTVYSHPLSMGGASCSHYGENSVTYMNIGQAMGAAMVDLLKYN